MNAHAPASGRLAPVISGINLEWTCWVISCSTFEFLRSHQLHRFLFDTSAHGPTLPEASLAPPLGRINPIPPLWPQGPLQSDPDCPCHSTLHLALPQHLHLSSGGFLSATPAHLPLPPGLCTCCSLLLFPWGHLSFLSPQFKCPSEMLSVTSGVCVPGPCSTLPPAVCLLCPVEQYVTAPPTPRLLLGLPVHDPPSSLESASHEIRDPSFRAQHEQGWGPREMSREPSPNERRLPAPVRLTMEHRGHSLAGRSPLSCDRK